MALIPFKNYHYKHFELPGEVITKLPDIVNKLDQYRNSDVVNKVVLIDKVHLKDKDIKIILHPSRSVKATAKTTNDQIIFYYGGIKHLHKSYLLKYLTHELLHIIQPTQTVSKRYEKEIGKMQRGGIGGIRYHLEPAEFEVQLATLIAHIKRYYNDTKNSILNTQRSKFAWDTKRGEILNDLYNIGTTTKERFKGLIRNNLLPFYLKDDKNFLQMVVTDDRALGMVQDQLKELYNALKQT